MTVSVFSMVPRGQTSSSSPRHCSLLFIPAPRSGEGHVVLPSSQFVELFLSPQLLLHYLMKEFET